MRGRFKFRAWDPDSRRMFKILSFGESTYVYMQWTGKRDDQDFLIYEEDIVVVDEDRKGTVKWVNEVASFVVDYDGIMDDEFFGDFDNIRVIGNIFEGEII